MEKKLYNYIYILIYCILLVPFLGVLYFNRYESIINILKVLSIGIITLFTLKNYNQIKFNKATITVIIFSFYEILISFLHSNLSPGILFSNYFLMVFLIFAQQQLSRKLYNFIYALCVVHNIIMILNIPSLISQMSVSTYNRVYFLGGKNSIIMFALPTIFYNYLSSYLKNGKLTLFNKTMIFISVISPLLCSSTTGFLVACLVVISLLLQNKLKINFKCLYIIYFILLIVILNIERFGDINFFNDLVVNKLNKDLTFTGRTNIWYTSFELIKSNLLGFGRGNTILSELFNGINECHNIFIQLLFDGGVPALFMFLYYFYICHKSNVQINDANRNKLIQFAKIVIFAFMFLGLTESMSYAIDLWLILIILNYLNNIDGESKQEE